MRILNFGSLNLDFFYSVEHFAQAGRLSPPVAWKNSAAERG